MADFDELLSELDFAISQAELLTAADTSAVVGMTEAESETAGAQLRLWREMDKLMALRLRRVRLQDKHLVADPEPRANDID